MAIYRLWIIQLSDKSLIYTRNFPHLEKRDSFTFPLITPQEFLQSLCNSLGISFNNNNSDVVSLATKESTTTLASIGFDQQSQYQLKSTSLSSLTSSNTISSTRRSDILSSETSLSKDDLILYNYLPLIICRFVNHVPRDNVMMSSSLSDLDREQFGLTNLILLVYEQSGFLFVCCPRIAANCDIIFRQDDEISLDFEQILLEEENISLAYTALNLLALLFVKENKSIKNLEWFVTSCMPFGTLVNNRFDNNLLKTRSGLSTQQSNSDNVETIKLYISEFVSTSFKRLPTPGNDDQTTFGTLTLDCSTLNLKECRKAELGINADNIGLMSIVKPFCCNLVNSSSLIYDLKYANQNLLNVVHYRFNGTGSDSRHMATTRPDLPQQRKLLSYRYTISKKIYSQNQPKSLIDESKNRHNISIQLFLNSKISNDEIKFNYFTVKFSFSQSKHSKKEVQTVGSSVSNLIVRESIKASQGQVRNEDKNFYWIVGQKMPKSRKVSLEFDLLLTEDKLQNLVVQCNFKFEQRFSTKLFPLKKTSVPEFNKINKIEQSPSAAGNEVYKTEIKECNLKYPVNMIEPLVKISRVNLLMEMDQRQAKKREVQKERIPELNGESTTLLIEYKLASFEYRLFPDIF